MDEEIKSTETNQVTEAAEKEVQVSDLTVPEKKKTTRKRTASTTAKDGSKTAKTKTAAKKSSTAKKKTEDGEKTTTKKATSKSTSTRKKASDTDPAAKKTTTRKSASKKTAEKKETETAEETSAAPKRRGRPRKTKPETEIPAVTAEPEFSAVPESAADAVSEPVAAVPEESASVSDSASDMIPDILPDHPEEVPQNTEPIQQVEEEQLPAAEDISEEKTAELKFLEELKEIQSGYNPSDFTSSDFRELIHINDNPEDEQDTRSQSTSKRRRLRSFKEIVAKSGLNNAVNGALDVARRILVNDAFLDVPKIQSRERNTEETIKDLYGSVGISPDEVDHLFAEEKKPELTEKPTVSIPSETPSPASAESEPDETAIPPTLLSEETENTDDAPENTVSNRVSVTAKLRNYLMLPDEEESEESADDSDKEVFSIEKLKQKNNVLDKVRFIFTSRIAEEDETVPEESQSVPLPTTSDVPDTLRSAEEESVPHAVQDEDLLDYVRTKLYENESSADFDTKAEISDENQNIVSDITEKTEEHSVNAAELSEEIPAEQSAVSADENTEEKAVPVTGEPEVKSPDSGSTSSEENSAGGALKEKALSFLKHFALIKEVSTDEEILSEEKPAAETAESAVPESQPESDSEIAESSTDDTSAAECKIDVTEPPAENMVAEVPADTDLNDSADKQSSETVISETNYSSESEPLSEAAITEEAAPEEEISEQKPSVPLTESLKNKAFMFLKRFTLNKESEKPKLLEDSEDRVDLLIEEELPDNSEKEDVIIFEEAEKLAEDAVQKELIDTEAEDDANELIFADYNANPFSDADHEAEEQVSELNADSSILMHEAELLSEEPSSEEDEEIHFADEGSILFDTNEEPPFQLTDSILMHEVENLKEEAEAETEAVIESEIIEFADIPSEDIPAVEENTAPETPVSEEIEDIPVNIGEEATAEETVSVSAEAGPDNGELPAEEEVSAEAFIETEVSPEIQQTAEDAELSEPAEEENTICEDAETEGETLQETETVEETAADQKEEIAETDEAAEEPVSEVSVPETAEEVTADPDPEVENVTEPVSDEDHPADSETSPETATKPAFSEHVKHIAAIVGTFAGNAGISCMKAARYVHANVVKPAGTGIHTGLVTVFNAIHSVIPNCAPPEKPEKQTDQRVIDEAETFRGSEEDYVIPMLEDGSFEHIPTRLEMIQEKISQVLSTTSDHVKRTVGEIGEKAVQKLEHVKSHPVKEQTETAPKAIPEQNTVLLDVPAIEAEEPICPEEPAETIPEQKVTDNTAKAEETEPGPDEVPVLNAPAVDINNINTINKALLNDEVEEIISTVLTGEHSEALHLSQDTAEETLSDTKPAAEEDNAEKDILSVSAVEVTVEEAVPDQIEEVTEEGETSEEPVNEAPEPVSAEEITAVEEAQPDDTEDTEAIAEASDEETTSEESAEDSVETIETADEPSSEEAVESIVSEISDVAEVHDTPEEITEWPSIPYEENEQVAPEVQSTKKSIGKAVYNALKVVVKINRYDLPEEDPFEETITFPEQDSTESSGIEEETAGIPALTSDLPENETGNNSRTSEEEAAEKEEMALVPEEGTSEEPKPEDVDAGESDHPEDDEQTDTGAILDVIDKLQQIKETRKPITAEKVSEKDAEQTQEIKVLGEVEEERVGFADTEYNVEPLFETKISILTRILNPVKTLDHLNPEAEISMIGGIFGLIFQFACAVSVIVLNLYYLIEQTAFSYARMTFTDGVWLGIRFTAFLFAGSLISMIVVSILNKACKGEGNFREIMAYQGFTSAASGFAFIIAAAAAKYSLMLSLVLFAAACIVTICLTTYALYKATELRMPIIVIMRILSLAIIIAVFIALFFQNCQDLIDIYMIIRNI